jgi:hypothetical protein
VYQLRSKIKNFFSSYWLEAIILSVGALSQTIFMKLVSFGGGYDTASYLAIGRMYARLPYDMWSIKYYYPPGQPLIFWLTGVTNFGSLSAYGVLVWLCGATYPLLIFKMLESISRKFAFFAAFLFTIQFQNSLFSKDLMPHYLGGFTLLLFMFFVLRSELSPRLPLNMGRGYFLGFLLTISYLIRPSNLYVGLLGFCIYYIFFQGNLKTNYRRHLAVTSGLVVPFLLLNLSLITLRPMEPNQELSKVSVTQNQGAFTMFQGIYIGGTLSYEKPAINVNCGSATKEIFSITENYLDRLIYPDSPVFNSYLNSNREIAIRGVLRDWWQIQGYQPYFYYINWALESQLTYEQKDQLLVRSIIENIRCEPLAFAKYVFVNTMGALKGEIWNYGEHKNKGFFYRDSNWVANYDPQPRGFFGNVSEPAFEDNLFSDFANLTKNAARIEFLEEKINTGIKMFPWINLFAFLGLFFTRGRARKLVVLFLGIAISNFMVAAICFPLQLRYYYPSVPFLFMACVITINSLLKNLYFLIEKSKLRGGNSKL